jgi:hypothetical protein
MPCHTIIHFFIVGIVCDGWRRTSLNNNATRPTGEDCQEASYITSFFNRLFYWVSLLFSTPKKQSCTFRQLFYIYCKLKLGQKFLEIFKKKKQNMANGIKNMEQNQKKNASKKCNFVIFVPNFSCIINLSYHQPLEISKQLIPSHSHGHNFYWFLFLRFIYTSLPNP